MQKKQVRRVVVRSSIALIIPILGQLFVDGWNWGVGDFVFAWVFFNILGLAVTFAQNKIQSRAGKIIAGVVIALVFAAIWIILATG